MISEPRNLGCTTFGQLRKYFAKIMCFSFFERVSFSRGTMDTTIFGLSMNRAAGHQRMSDVDLVVCFVFVCQRFDE